MDIAEIAARLQALEDREAIRALIASYGPLADAGDSAGLSACGPMTEPMASAAWARRGVARRLPG